MIYEVELIHVGKSDVHRITFILPTCALENHPIVTRREDQHKWKISIVKMDSTGIIDGNAIAYCKEYPFSNETICVIPSESYAHSSLRNSKNSNIILQYIEYKNDRYVPNTTCLCLFPVLESHFSPLYGIIQEDSMLLTTDISNRSIVVQPLDVLPFMDINGVFQYEYIAIYREDEHGKWRPCKKPVTLYQVNDNYKAILDKKAQKIYAIQNAFTFITPVHTNL